MTQKQVRVRFAPSPTGWMHLGNVRAALINKLFASQKNGVFVLRIEDTDAERTIDVDGQKIMDDLSWLMINHDEGPFFQSKRESLYKKHLTLLQEKNLVYRCFETTEELDAMRAEQRAQGLPPRYNRAGLKLSKEEIKKNLADKKPFIWRFKIPDGSLTINDLARGTITYNMEHFSDFAITRKDGSFTFIFANFVDDLTMGITHIFRGEDHLTNSANQAALYQAVQSPLPDFYHLPLICNSDGKKLSKRDFGFSLEDLKQSGFLPEAINNYLAIIGSSFKQEIMDLTALSQMLQFNESSPTGSIHYDVEKLRWVNQKWIRSLPVSDLTQRCIPFLQENYKQIKEIAFDTIVALIGYIQEDMVTLHDAVEFLNFYFVQPDVAQEILIKHNIDQHADFFQQIINDYADKKLNPEDFFSDIKNRIKTEKKPLREIFTLLRLALTGKPQGLGIKALVSMLNPQETIIRINNIVHREYQ